jgi:hypothetical protein
MAVQDRPICAKCSQVVEVDPIYEAFCGHDRCPSAVWHGLCLMKWREMRHAGEAFEVIGVMLRPLAEEHTEHG